MFWPDTQTGVDVEPARKTVQSAVRKYFTEGGVGVPPTVPGGDWFNQITNELLNLLAAANIDPSKIEDDQILKAIKRVSNSTSAREALRRSYAEAGYTLVEGSFEVGGTLTSTFDVLLNEKDGSAYSWVGSYPGSGLYVDPGTDPNNDSMFVLRSSELLRYQVEHLVNENFYGTDLLASFFRRDDSSVYLYESRDGVNFSPLLDTPVFTVPGRAVRDPSIIYYDDAWWCVYSDVPSNSDFNTTYFGVAKSYNLVDWVHAFDVDTGVQNTWAPDWAVDDDGSIYVIVALDFVTYLIPITLPSGTTGSPINLNVPGSSIDGVIQKENGVYYLFIKNEITKYIERYEGPSIGGPYIRTGSGDWAGWGANVEGPSLIKQADGSWRVYFDGYSVGKYYTSTSVSLASNAWTNKSEISQTGLVRHGSVYPLKSQNRRVDALYASVQKEPSPVNQAAEVVVGMASYAAAVTYSSPSPQNSCWMHFRTDADVAIFQSRNSNGQEGVDFVNRYFSGYASIEIIGPGYVHEALRFNGPSKGSKPSFPRGIYIEPWQTPTSFSNSWASDTNEPIKYRKDHTNCVRFNGIVKGGLTTVTTVIFTLPVGYRPAHFAVFPVVSNDTSFGSVGITPDGNVVFLSGTNVKLDLSAVSFYLD